MKTYRITLTPSSSFITPLHADTLWGHFCWLVKWRDGEQALMEFLKAFQEDPPFILSDGFPGDMLPAPFHLPIQVKETDTRKAFRTRKALKNLKWLSFSEFKAAQEAKPFELTSADRRGFMPVTTLHSSINRITGTTGDEGTLFELEEHSLSKGAKYISVYLKIKDGWQEKVAALFRDLALMGYGRKRSVGKGAFKVAGLEPFDGFAALDKTNGFVSLSNFIPEQNDPTEGFYKVFVKYGKLGGEYAFTGKPFKRPVMMLKAGSVFRSETARPFYGRMVRNVLPEMPEVLQYGYAFAVPVRL